MRVALIVAALAGTAAAKPTVVSAKLDGDLAHLVVRQPIARTDRGVTLEIVEVPAGSLVVAARVDNHALALMPVAEAETRFSEIAEGPIAGAPAWAAKIVRGDASTVSVSIAAPFAGLAELELELVAPTCYARDARLVAVPAGWAAEQDLGCGAGSWVRLPDAALAQKHDLDRLGTHATRVALDDLHVARLEVDLPAKFGEVPADLATVILVDLSRSMGEKKLKQATALVLDYLHRAPASRVQLLGYARHPFGLVPGWRTAQQALPIAERVLGTMPLRNGSNLDEALATAQLALNALPGTHRIVVISDELLPERIKVDQLRGALAPDTLVHVVAIDSGTLVREDEGTLGSLAAATYGMRVRGDDNAEALLRPISVDHLALHGTRWNELVDSPCPADLGEGVGCTTWFAGEPGSTAITVEGMVWGKKLTRVLAPDLSRQLDVARELSGAQMLDAKHQAIADQLARAVNSAWAMFGRWGGSGGYNESPGGFGMTGGGSFSSGDRGGIGHGCCSGSRTAESLESQLRPALRACGAEGERVQVGLELTFEETVEVTVQPLGSDLAAMRKRACLIDAIWDIELAIAVPVEHTATIVTLD